MVIKESSLWIHPPGNELYASALVDRSQATYRPMHYLHRVLPGKVKAPQLVEKFPAFYRTQKDLAHNSLPA
jgi:hypothetical protein